METAKNINLLTRRNKYLIVFSFVFLSVFILSLLLHLTPMSLISSTVDYAAHHYYLTSFVALIGLLFCIKNYIGNNSKIKYLQHKLEQASKIMHFSRSYEKNTIQMKLVKPFNKSNSEQITKEQLNTLEFPDYDVLPDKEAVLRRDFDLQYAMKLGNNYKLKVTIYFADKNSTKHVNTTIWHTNSAHVVLKGGLIIPLKSIYKVEY